MKEKEMKTIDDIKDFNYQTIKDLEDIRKKLDNPIWEEVVKPVKGNTLYWVTWTLRMCLAVVILITSAISMSYTNYDVWIAVFCLALLNIVDLAEKE